MMYYHGEGVHESLREAFVWLIRSAQQGYALAQHHLAYMYEEGIEVDENIAIAISYYARAAEKGLSVARIWLESLASKRFCFCST